MSKSQVGETSRWWGIKTFDAIRRSVGGREEKEPKLSRKLISHLEKQAISL